MAVHSFGDIKFVIPTHDIEIRIDSIFIVL
jgi:hypothetical protein